MAQPGQLTPADRYSKELPSDRSYLAQAWKLLEIYSKVPASEIDAHVSEVRDKAFAIFHYPCIGRWRFLDIYIASTPQYPEILNRLEAGEKFLDVGCCFGQILRQLVFDGVPSKNLAGTDLRPEFIELGYELFKDKDTLEAQFVTGDILDPNNKSMEVLDGQFGIVHSASFFHLFGWDDQIRIGERMVRFFKPDAKALIFGRQVGSWQPESLEAYGTSASTRYHHNVESFQNLWDEIGEKTGTKWKVTGSLFDVKPAHSIAGLRTALKFAVSKVT